MELEDSAASNILPSGPCRRSVEETKIDHLLDGIVLNVKGLERKSRDLDKRNAELVSALEQANERMVRFEQAASTHRELTRIALKTAADVLGQAEESIEFSHKSARDEDAGLHAEAARKALDLQQQAVAVLQAAREEALRRNQDSTRQALQVITETRESILSMVESLAGLGSDQYLVPGNPPCSHKLEQPDKAVRGEGARGVEPTETRFTSMPLSLYAEPGALSEPTWENGRAIHKRNGAGSPAESSASEGPINGLGQSPRHSSSFDDRFFPSVDNDDRRAQSFVGGTHQWAGLRAGPATEQLTQSFVDVFSPQESTQSIELVASPIRSFSAISGFSRAVRGVPGVLDVRAQGYEAGTLRLAVKCADSVCLAGRLSELSDLVSHLVSVEDDRVEVEVRAEDNGAEFVE